MHCNKCGNELAGFSQVLWCNHCEGLESELRAERGQEQAPAPVSPFQNVMDELYGPSVPSWCDLSRWRRTQGSPEITMPKDRVVSYAKDDAEVSLRHYQHAFPEEFGTRLHHKPEPGIGVVDDPNIGFFQRSEKITFKEEATCRNPCGEVYADLRLDTRADVSLGKSGKIYYCPPREGVDILVAEPPPRYDLDLRAAMEKISMVLGERNDTEELALWSKLQETLGDE